ncbi:MAG: hypothetical protein K2X63_10045 [Burkholderiaceae bacterium]|nr:hypothetical protein [Burkholderiaceae bacterium]
MKTKIRYFLIAIVILIALACCTLWTFEPHSFFIDGDEIGGVAGIGIALMVGAIALIAILFAAAVTGMVLVGVALFLALLAIVIVGSVGIALSPLLLPFLILMGIIWLFNRPKTA